MHSAVIGMGFGDEGKGLITDYLCSSSENPLVVRFSGGQQAGHTVVLGEKRHTFSNFGSGSFRRTPTFWSEYCTFDPVGAIRELDVLESLPVSPKLILDPQVPITTPCEKYYDQNSEWCRDHGTCGVGVGQTWQREQDNYSIKVLDLESPLKIMKIKLDQLQKHYYEFSGEVNLEEFWKALKSIKSRLGSEFEISGNYLKTSNHKDVIYEGSQGILLDQEAGFFPNVTRSSVGLRNIFYLVPMLSELDQVIYVTRAYQTRHGNGPMTHQDIEIDLVDDSRENNVTNTYQGEFRRGILDLDLLQYGLNSQKQYSVWDKCQKVLAITCLDHLNEYKFVSEDKVLKFKSERSFTRAIADILGFNKILVSRSPEGANIETLN